MLKKHPHCLAPLRAGTAGLDIVLFNAAAFRT
jgi:hypothetical protein